jgi:hypothetical protein
MNKPNSYKDGSRMITSKDIRKPVIGRYVKIDGKDVFIKKEDNK